MEEKEIQLVDNKFFWVLKEIHTEDCDCSYCGSNRIKPTIHYGLNIPKDWKASNSWYVIKYAEGKYIRWVNRWIRLLSFKS
jgi:hypothetical protein